MTRSPHFLYGTALLPWLRMLRDAGSVSPRRLPLAAAITLAALTRSLPAHLESWRYGSRIRATPAVAPPLFVLGHWRAGTTLLHNLLCLDAEQLAFGSLWDAFNPTLNLSVPAPHWADRLLPKTRLQDGVPIGVATPQEEEFAILLLAGVSPYGGYAFPRRARHYARYLDFVAATPRERERWCDAYAFWVRKLSLKYGRRLVLKSPANTARIPLLLELFPEARFVHIHRDPFRVFQSSLRNERTMLEHFALQPSDPAVLPEGVLARGQLLYEAYRRDRTLIPAGRLVEIGYDALVADPEGALGWIYAALELTFHDRLRQALRDGAHAHRAYLTTSHDPLSAELRAQVRARWAAAFAA